MAAPGEVTLEKLNLTDGDLVLLRLPEELVEHNTAVSRAFQQMLAEQGFSNCLIVVLRPGSDVTALDEDEMRELGWVRAESITAGDASMQ